MLLTCLLVLLGRSDVDPVKFQYHRDSNERRIITYGADFGLTLSFAGSSPNWSSGGSSNINGNGFVNAFAQVKRPNTSFDNVFRVNLGGVSTRQLDNYNIRYRILKKNLDNVFLDCKLGHTITAEPGMSIFGGLNFQTQLLPGYKYSRNAIGREVGTINSSFLSQGQTQFALGMEYKPLPTFFIRMGYVTLKQTYVINQSLYDIRNEPIIARVSEEDQAEYNLISPDAPHTLLEKTIRMNEIWKTEPDISLSEIASIQCPVLVMAGDDDVIAHAHTISLYEALPLGQLAIIPGTSHGLVKEKPALLIAVMMQFLEDLSYPITRDPIRRTNNQ